MSIDFPSKTKPFARPAITPEQQEQKLKGVADLYEKQFLREMVKAMRTTVSESEFMPAGQGEKIFKEQLDDNYVDKWSQKGGIGLSDIIYQQLIEKYGAQLGIRAPQQSGPRGMHALPEAYKKEQVAKSNLAIEARSATSEAKAATSEQENQKKLIEPDSKMAPLQNNLLPSKEEKKFVPISEKE